MKNAWKFIKEEWKEITGLVTLSIVSVIVVMFLTFSFFNCLTGCSSENIEPMITIEAIFTQKICDKDIEAGSPTGEHDCYYAGTCIINGKSDTINGENAIWRVMPPQNCKKSHKKHFQSRLLQCNVFLKKFEISFQIHQGLYFNIIK